MAVDPGKRAGSASEQKAAGSNPAGGTDYIASSEAVFDQPLRAAVDSACDVYFADTYNKRALKLLVQ